MAKHKRPEDVFTPRESKVNARMYVDRPHLEARLTTALRGPLHVLVHGESGAGKSWLYKKVLADVGASFIPVNLANASRLGSIQAECRNVLDRREDRTLTSVSEKKLATVDVVVAKGNLENQRNYEVGAMEPFEALLRAARKDAGDKQAVIVMDNLESIFDSAAQMKELADIITLLDDERYAAYRVKIVIVGVPTGVRDYYQQTPSRATVANRLTEVPEVGRLTKEQAADLIRRGFVEELDYAVRNDNLEAIIRHVSWVTDCIPQRLHEYCLELAGVANIEGGALREDMLQVADARWIESSLSNCYSAVESAMNDKRTKVGRRNQTLYVLGQLEAAEFQYNDVERSIREHFPESTDGVTMDCSTLLAHLADATPPVLRRTPKGDAYQFSDPKYRMCIRAMLHKDSSGTVVKSFIDGVSSGLASQD